MTTRAPRTDGVKARIAAFFAANPDEELTRPMLLEKFGVGWQAGDNAVRELRQDGLLESVHVIRLRSKGARRDGE